MLTRLLFAVLLMLVTAIPAMAEGLDEIAREAEHMVEDVAEAKGAQPTEARALAKEIADHASEAEEALEKASAAAAVAGARRVVAASLAVQRAADADVRARVSELEAAVNAFVPQLRAAVRAAAAPRPTALPRTGGFPAPSTMAGGMAAGLLLFLVGTRLVDRIARG